MRDGRRFFGGKAYDESRTAVERALFATALHDTMDLWYSHQGTVVYMLTKLPDDAMSMSNVTRTRTRTRTRGYHESGWTTYESCCASQIKRTYLFSAHWSLILDLGDAEGALDGL